MKTRIALVSLLAVALTALFVGVARAEDAKEVTLSGKLTCAKCALKLTEQCQNVLQVSADGKEVNYFLTDNDISTKYHKNVCTAPKDVKITGTVAEKDGKMWLTATKIEEVKA